MGQRKAAKPKAAQQQQQQAQQAAPQAAAAKAAAAAAGAGGGTGLHAGATAAGAAAGHGAASPEASMGALRELEQKKRRLATQLKDVERQIYDLETRYLEGCNPNANALTGYEGLRNSLGSAKPRQAQAVAQQDRIFSGSSTSTLPPRTQA